MAEPSPVSILAGIIVAAAVTWTLRAAPFLVIARLRSSPLVAYLGARLPAGLMLILAADTLVGADSAGWRSAVPVAVALIVTVSLHLWRGNAILSIGVGTAVAVVLQTLAAQ